MKRVLVTTLLALAILFYTGCDFTTDGGGGTGGGSTGGTGGGSGNQIVPTTVSGRVVDQAGIPLEGIKLSIGLKTVTTGADGTFKFTGLIGGTANLTGRGGQSELYQLDRSGLEIVADKANELGDITAYKINGVGVIVYVEPPPKTPVDPQPAGLSRTSMVSSLVEPVSDIELEILRRGRAHIPVKALSRGVSLSRSRAVGNATLLDENNSYIELKWEKLNNPAIAQYKVVYAGKDGSGTTDVVWTSAAVNASTPAELKAKLNFALELVGRVDDIGEYFFKVKGYDAADNEVIELPKVKVSFGMLMNSFPGNHSYDNITKTLSWAAVADSTNYRVQVPVAGLKSAYITSVNYDFSTAGLNEGQHYILYVLAFANDADGWPLELTIVKGGFIY